MRFNFFGCGEYDIPFIEKDDVNPTEFIGFNYAKTHKGNTDVCVHFFLDDYQIQTLMEQRRSKTDTTANVPDRANTTTTYDRWQKNNRKKFDDWYFGGQNQKKKK